MYVIEDIRRNKGRWKRMTIDEETINQIEFIKILANRLDANECPTRIKADAIRLRRELNTLSKMQDWESRWNRMKEKCDK